MISGLYGFLCFSPQSKFLDDCLCPVRIWSFISLVQCKCLILSPSFDKIREINFSWSTQTSKFLILNTCFLNIKFLIHDICFFVTDGVWFIVPFLEHLVSPYYYFCTILITPLTWTRFCVGIFRNDLSVTVPYTFTTTVMVTVVVVVCY